MSAFDDRALLEAVKACIRAHGGDASDVSADVSALRDLEQAIDAYAGASSARDWCPICDGAV